VTALITALATLPLGTFMVLMAGASIVALVNGQLSFRRDLLSGAALGVILLVIGGMLLRAVVLGIATGPMAQVRVVPELSRSAAVGFSSPILLAGLNSLVAAPDAAADADKLGWAAGVARLAAATGGGTVLLGAVLLIFGLVLALLGLGDPRRPVGDRPPGS
jgi:hypothetical protein